MALGTLSLFGATPFCFFVFGVCLLFWVLLFVFVWFGFSGFFVFPQTTNAMGLARVPPTTNAKGVLGNASSRTLATGSAGPVSLNWPPVAPRCAPAPLSIPPGIESKRFRFHLESRASALDSNCYREQVLSIPTCIESTCSRYQL